MAETHPALRVGDTPDWNEIRKQNDAWLEQHTGRIEHLARRIEAVFPSGSIEQGIELRRILTEARRG